MAENSLGNTQYFRTKPDQDLEVKEVLDLVYNAMDEKGYKVALICMNSALVVLAITFASVVFPVPGGP